MFHRVLPASELDGYFDPGVVVSEESFAAFIPFLRQYFEIVPLGELVERLSRGPLQTPACSLTFDDGWEDNYRCAWPILKRERAPATIFVTSSYIGRDRLRWEDAFWRLTRHLGMEERSGVNRELRARHSWLAACGDPTSLAEVRACLAACPRSEQEALSHALIEDLQRLAPGPATELPGRSYMHIEEIRAMAEDGVEFGAHTVSHPRLTRLGNDDAWAELAQGKRVLEERLGRAVMSLAYPYGDCDARVRDLAAKAGYSVAVTVEPLPARPGTDPMLLPRVGVCEEMVASSSGRFDPSLFLFHISVALARALGGRSG
jgi:peptidoglycan/xylan/chitin deacetylase (PgdA/CDA1 family)